MKAIASQLSYFFSRTRERNIKALLQFLALLVGLIAIYSVIFHFLMLREGQEHTWITGVYWTLTVMSTLGFGDITFHTDLGRLFSIVVLLSGTIFILILLPFTFIRFFYAPWLEAQAQSRAPRQLPDDIENHVILTSFDPSSVHLVERLVAHKFPYAIATGDMQHALEISDQKYRVVVGELGDPETYRKMKVDQTALVVACSGDMLNTNIVATVREVTEDATIVATAENEEAIDILKLAGATHVFMFRKLLGEALARKTLGIRTCDNIIGQIDSLLVAETPVMNTSLENKRLAECGLREKTGLNIIGCWEGGMYIAPNPDTVLTGKQVLLLAGTRDQFELYDEEIVPRDSTEAPVLIIGGGRVGRSVAATLERHKMTYRIIEKDEGVVLDNEKYIQGSAAKIETLKRAGIDEARSIIITPHDDEMNIYMTIYCRKLRPSIQIISRANTDRNVSKLHRAGANQVMSYASLATSTVFNLLRPRGLQILAEGLILFRKKVSPQFIGKSLANSNIRGTTGCNIVGVSSEGEMIINPEPSFTFSSGDELFLVGSNESQRKYLETFPD